MEEVELVGLNDAFGDVTLQTLSFSINAHKTLSFSINAHIHLC